MRKWLRRFTYLFIILVWASLMAMPIMAFVLATNGEFTLGNTRVFMVRAEEQSGIGMQTTRTVRRETQCVKTSVRYFMWEGESENFVSCDQCIDNLERVAQGSRCVVP